MIFDGFHGLFGRDTVIPSTSRPGERRDPFAVSSLFGIRAETLHKKRRQGLWVPAFAGTTRGEIVSYAIALPQGAGIALRHGSDRKRREKRASISSYAVALPTTATTTRINTTTTNTMRWRGKVDY
jgi:hypothetical protein